MSFSDRVAAAALRARASKVSSASWLNKLYSHWDDKNATLTQMLGMTTYLEEKSRASYDRSMADFRNTISDVYKEKKLEELSAEELRRAVAVHMKNIMTRSASGKFRSVIETFSAAMCYHSAQADIKNPFDDKQIKLLKKSVFKISVKFGEDRKHAPGMSDHDARVLVSHLLSGDASGGLGHSDHKELHKNLMLCVASVLSRYTAMRGVSLLNIRLHHITVIDDPHNEMGFTFCIWLPKVKNDINGKNGGAHFPLVHNLRDGYLCPALHLAFWLLFMEAEFTAAIQAHERSVEEGGRSCAIPSSSSSAAGAPNSAIDASESVGSSSQSHSELVEMSLNMNLDSSRKQGPVLFPHIKRDSIHLFEPWSSRPAFSLLSFWAEKALGSGRTATFHTGRQSAIERMTILGCTLPESLTWGGWFSDKVLNYASPRTDAMLAISRKLSGQRVHEDTTSYLPYGGSFGGQSGALPTQHGFSRIIAAARLTVDAFLFKSCALKPLITGRVGKRTLLYQLHALFPKLELRSHLQPLARPPAPKSLGVLASAGPIARKTDAAPLHSPTASSVSASASLSFSFVRRAVSSAVDAAVSAISTSMSPRSAGIVIGQMARAVGHQIESRPNLLGAVTSAASLPSLPTVASVYRGEHGGAIDSYANVYKAWFGKLTPRFPAIRDYRVCGAWHYVSVRYG